MKVAIVGITGLVGTKIVELLEKGNFPVTELILISRNRKIKHIKFKDKDVPILSIYELLQKEPDLVFLACSSELSREWAPKLVRNNIWVIDNSSAFRSHPSIPLVIPEINGNLITNRTKLIANPNCSTTQLVMVLYPLHKKYKIKRVVVSTYQSVSGAGYNGIKQLENERGGDTELSDAFPTNIDLNCIPLCGDLNDDMYTMEEVKLQNETLKILGDDVKVTATAVRVPVLGGHSESVNIEFYNEYKISEVINILENTSGIKVKDMPCPSDVKNEEDVWVGRIRRDDTQKNSLNLWIVADNLMKGGSLNAVQIAEIIIKKNKNNHGHRAKGPVPTVASRRRDRESLGDP